MHRAAGPLSSLMLHKATASLNSRIRTNGLSAKEVLLQCDQFTNLQIPLNDKTIIAAKHIRSEKSFQNIDTKVEPENEEDDLEVVVPSPPSNVDPETSDAHPIIVHLENSQNTPPQDNTAVSYTHLTLPTILLV